MIGMELLNAMYGNPLQGPQPITGPSSLPGGQNTGMMSGGTPSPPQAPPMAPAAATQSPPDLVNLYMQLQNRQRSANEIDRGLSMMAAANSTPGMAKAIMGSAPGATGAPDPGAQLSTLLQLQNYQRLANMPAPGSGGAGAGAGAGAGGAAPIAMPKIDPAAWAGMSPDQRQKWLSDASTAQIAPQTQLTEQRQKEVQDALNARPDLTNKLGELNNNLDMVKNTQNADGSLALQTLLNNGWKKSALIGMLHPEEHEGFISGTEQQLEQWWAGLTPQEQAVASTLKQISGQAYGEAFSSLGGSSRRSTQEVAGINSGLSQIKNITQPYQNPDGSGYLKGINDLQNRTQRAMANAYGASQELNLVPDTLKWDMNGKPLMDPQYLPGGKNYEGVGGQWALNPPPKSGGAAIATGGGAPAPAVAYLRAHPETASQFDAKYGVGASKVARGE